MRFKECFLEVNILTPPFLWVLTNNSAIENKNYSRDAQHVESLELNENIRIDCNSNEIAVAISTKSGAFNGMVYPKGLSKNSSCLAEFLHEKSPVRYRLPLRSCNTMSTEMAMCKLQLRRYLKFIRSQVSQRQPHNPSFDFFLGLEMHKMGDTNKWVGSGTSIFLRNVRLSVSLLSSYPQDCGAFNLYAGKLAFWSLTQRLPSKPFVISAKPTFYSIKYWSVLLNSKYLQDDGGIEYFNTIVVQPHLKLVTNQGRGFHIRCIYTTKDQTIAHNMNFSMTDTEPLLATAPMPGCTMKIYYGDPHNKEVAENVKIGDPLTLVIAIDSQEVYGLKISDCLVRDGLGWGEQYLIDENGCPVDEEIMGNFEYSKDKTVASVRFQAHKFPYTDSVYYQCNVKLCIKSGGCLDTPPHCGKTLGVRRRRQIGNDTSEEGAPATIEVYSGLYVNEATDGKNDIVDHVQKEKKINDPDQICISQKNFAIGIAIAGLILILLVILAIIFLLARRRKQKDTGSTGSSIYSGPYTNTAYSHSS
ncbi:hypothetical protein RUM43_012124 [Polyplax serrata]|uniref:ZP domain-containing protein n=1 Tax=Polyplax serrata TaxID=468196 RepID=A0AAN8S4C8_POLSC